MSAKEYMFWASGGMVLATVLFSLATAGWFFGMPAKGLFAFVVFVVMFPLVGDIRFNLKHWKRLRRA